MLIDEETCKSAQVGLLLKAVETLEQKPNVSCRTPTVRALTTPGSLWGVLQNLQAS